jgi:hypothetical protein
VDNLSSEVSVGLLGATLIGGSIAHTGRYWYWNDER